MPIKRHRWIAIVALALLGTALGAPSGYWLGRATLLRTARNGLANYASELAGRGDEYAAELRVIRNAFNPSPFPFCSHEEISRMQALTFRSLQVKEVGRIHNGLLYCSAFLGRLDKPHDMPPLTMTLRNGTQIYTNAHLMIAAMAQGTIIANSDVDVILNPNAFDYWSRPHVHFMVVTFNRATTQTARIAGEALDLDSSAILAQRDKEADGKLYRSRCAQHSDVCVVTAESASDILSGSRALLLEYSGLGGLAGFGAGLAIAQFYMRRIGLAQQLRRAIRNDAISLVYQPIWEIPSRRLVGAEALVRWSDEDGVAVAPDFFVRIAEDKGFIGELTAMVVRRATGEIGDLLRQNPGFTLSINIAAADLEDDSLLPQLERHVRQAGIKPEQIALELTERSTTGIDCLQSAIQHLHKQGYQIHIDDFGTGFSSLSYLHELSVDAIKIDRTFTRTSGTDAVTASILPQILSMAESVGVGVIVEGVETEAQLNFLESTGKSMCAQGWYFGRPVAAPGLLAIYVPSNSPAEVGIL
jgi:sensor c-di-GMP phosphodiesterase-like protein